MNDAPPPPAGWYPDPHGSGHRYWDGSAWTEQTAPGEEPAAPTYGPPTGAGYGQAPGYGASFPAYGGYNDQPSASPGNTLSIIGIVCGAIAFVLCPPLFGIAGIVLGSIGLSRQESLGWWAIGVSVAGLVFGMVIGMLLFSVTGGFAT